MTACVFPSYGYLFQKNAFIEWWNRRFRGSAKQNFLHCPTMVGKPLHNSLKIFPWNLQFSGGISASFLKIKRVKNPLNFSVYHCQVFSKCSRIQNVDFFKCILLIHQSMKHFLDCHRNSVPLISFLDNLNHRCSTYFTTARRFSRVQDILWKYSFNTIEN